MLQRLRLRVIGVGAPLVATLALLIVAASWFHASSAFAPPATASEMTAASSDHSAAHHHAHKAHEQHAAAEAEPGDCEHGGCDDLQCCVGAVGLVSPVPPAPSPLWTKHRRTPPDRLASRPLKPAIHPPKRV